MLIPVSNHLLKNHVVRIEMEKIHKILNTTFCATHYMIMVKVCNCPWHTCISHDFQQCQYGKTKKELQDLEENYQNSHKGQVFQALDN